MTKYFSLGDIKCDFEADFCGWNATGEDYFLLKRENPASLQGQGLDGPKEDFSGNPEKFFVHVSALGLENEGWTILRTEMISNHEPPIACVKFWFQILVKTYCFKLKARIIKNNCIYTYF